MTLTTAQAFNSFIDEIEPTPHHYGVMVPARVLTVHERLSQKFPDSNLTPYDHNFLIGSAAKRTATRPIDDIDVLAVFSNSNNGYSKYQFDSQGFLYRIQQAYAGLSTQKVGTRGQAVRVFFENGGHVDIACVFKVDDDEFKIPAGNGSWLSTRPLQANRWFAKRHADLGYQLKAVVKVLKKWNYAHSKRLNSFHLETMAGNAFTSLGTNHRDALRMFFDTAGTWLDVSDPGGTGANLASGLTWSKRQDIVSSFSSAASRASTAVSAEARGDHAEAKRQWRILLGDSFPTH